MLRECFSDLITDCIGVDVIAHPFAPQLVRHSRLLPIHFKFFLTKRNIDVPLPRTSRGSGKMGDSDADNCRKERELSSYPWTNHGK
jgi:hypothetical protein